MSAPPVEAWSEGRAPQWRPLRLVVVTETFPPEINGVANTMQQLVEGLAALGHRVSLIRPRQPVDRALAGRGAVASVGVKASVAEHLVTGLPLPGYRGLRFGLPALGRLRRWWAAERPDAVYVATQGPLGHAALQAARRLGIPTLTGFHTQFHEYCRHYGVGLLMRPIVQVLRHFHNRSDATLVPTCSLQQDLAAAGFRNLRVFSRGVDTALFSPQRRSAALRASWGCGEGGLAAVYVGRVAAEKNVELGIEAFAAMQRSTPELCCILVGDGPELEHLRRHHPGCIYTGARTGEELAAHYASADLFVFPSTTETFGNVLLEAMASGLAPVAFDYAAAREYLVDGVNGYSVPFGDHGAFVAAAERAARDPAAVRRCGAAARQRAESLSWTRVLRALEASVFQVIDGSGERGNGHEPIPATSE